MSTMRSLMAAREHLLADGEVPAHLAQAVRPQVLQSWQRSVQNGAEVSKPVLAYKGTRTAHEVLRRAADPVLSRLAEQLVGLEAGVLLADHEATLVQRWVPDRAIVPMLDRIHAEAGFDNSERSIGTNGTGSVVEVGAAFQVSGHEHLAEALRPFTCIGVPIHHPITRRLEGVITMTCRATASNPLLTPLMTSTAHEVEGRLLAQASTAERQLLDEYLLYSRGRHRPVAVISGNLLIAGPQVTELLDGVDRARLWETVLAVFSGSGADEQALADIAGRLRIARCVPVHGDSGVLGAVIEFDAVAPTRRQTTLRTTVALPSKSTASAQAVAHATRLAARGVPMLVEGEPGVGKLTLAHAVLRAAGVSLDEVALLDASTDWARGSSQFVSALREALDSHAPAVLLRHLELLPAGAAAATASELERAPESVRLIATITTSPGAPPPDTAMRRLIDTIGVGQVTVLPLRERREDIALAAATMVSKHGGERGIRLSKEALRCLVRAPWPGNFRQLETTIRGAISATTAGEILPSVLPLELQEGPRRQPLSPIEELELSAILDALRKHRGNKQAAAQAVGISRSTLYRKLRSYRIDPDADVG